MTVGLDNAGTGPASRLMTVGGNSIQYGIYKDSAHSPGAIKSGSNTATGTGPSCKSPGLSEKEQINLNRLFRLTG